MPLTEARALLQDRHRRRELGHCLPEEPDQDREALRQLAWDCELFSPVVGIEEWEPPESLILDITGCARHFGGEQKLAETLQTRLQQQGFHTRIGVTETFGGAWAMTHYGPQGHAICIVPDGELESQLRSLPASALRLTSDTLDRLRQVGLRTVGQLLALPRSSLPARFGPELLLRIDQALGTAPELITPERRPEILRETWETEEPFSDPSLLERLAGDLLDRMLSTLQDRRFGIRRLVWELEEEERKITTRSLELLQPSMDRSHLLMLLSLQWESLTLTAGIQRISLKAEQIEPLTVRRQTLWELETGESSPSVRTLIETLSNRLGRDAVLRPYLRSDPQPEHAFGYEPLVETVRKVDRLRLTAGKTQPVLTRPLWLKRDVPAVEVTVEHRRGPPVQIDWQRRQWTVRHTWGPERITTGWWRSQMVRRDYFQVEIEDGRRLWLFRDLATEKWFLHACFD